jgi:Cu/Ag efflux protein CusF
MNNKHGLASRTVLISVAGVFFLASFFARVTHGANVVDGFLCCNAYSDGQEISDLNAPSAERHRVPVGSPIHVISVGKYKAKLDIENKKQVLINDNSQALSMPEFVKRFVVAEDPSAKIKTFSTNVQVAIADGRLIHGMTREQVLMSLGYPTYDDVPNLSSKTWMYWITDHAKFRVTFGTDDRVADVENVPDAKTQILMD